MLPPEHEELVQALLEALRREGAPAGTWLVDIDRVRMALREADELLMRLYDAVISNLPPFS